MRLQGKVALVTGAGGGFGEGIARLFAAEGAKLVCADMRAEAAAAVASSIGDMAIAVTGDVSRGPDVQAMVDAAVSSFGGLDIVVNNAGTTHRNRPMLEVEADEFEENNVRPALGATTAACFVRRLRRLPQIFCGVEKAGERPLRTSEPILNNLR